MNKIDIDFSGHISAVQKLSWILMVSGVLSLIIVIWQMVQLNQKIIGATAIRDELRSQLATQAANDKRAKRESLNNESEVEIPEKKLRWRDLFEAIESASGDDVALLEFEPNVKTMEVRLTGEARSLDAVIAYLRRLQSSEGLKDIHIVSHQEQIDNPLRPVRFEVNARWLH